MTVRSIVTGAAAGLVAAGSVVLVLAGSVAAEQTAIPAGNLLTNPGAEKGGASDPHGEPRPAGWMATGINRAGEPQDFGIVVRRYDPKSVVPPTVSALIGGSRNYFYSPRYTVGIATQVLDVARAAAEIDGGGVKACLSGYLGAVGTYADGAFISVEFLGADESSLGQLRIGPLTPLQRNNKTNALRRAAERAVPANTRELKVVLVMEHWTGALNKPSVRQGAGGSAFADNISVGLAKGACEATLALECVKKALVATVTPSTVQKVQRVRFAVKGGKRTKQVQDARAPYTGRFTMDGFTGKRLTVTATLTAAYSGPLTVKKQSKRC